MSTAFLLLTASIAFLCAPFANSQGAGITTNTLTVGRTDDPTTTITITPTLNQPVKLECQRSERFKDWFTGDPGCRIRVTPTEGEINTTPGHDRTLLISLFKPIHAATYSCIVDHYSSTSTVYPVVLVNPSSTNTLTVGRKEDSTTTITITPTLSQPVWLECQRTGASKDWFTGDPRSRVSPTEGEISTKSGQDRTLYISSFKPIHATTYNCIVDHYSTLSTVYPVVLATSNSVIPKVCITVGRTDDPTNTITITPTFSQPVQLECQRTGAFKDWFTGDPRSRVKSTEGEIFTKSGKYRTLLISSFQPIHATTYSCIVDHYSTISTEYPVVLETSKPIPPSHVGVSKGVSDGSPSLEVSWTAVDGSGITYTVWYSTSSGTETEPPSGALTKSGITDTSTTLSGLTQGTMYYIWVAAVSSDEQGPYSTRVSDTTYTVPDPPTNLIIYPPSGSCDELNVTWKKPYNTGGLPVKYTVYGNGVEIQSMIANNSTILSDLTPDTEYTVTVVAVNELGEGRNVKGTGRTRPEAPIISLSAISSTQLHIMLTAPNGSSSLTYKCTITEIDMPPITVTGTELEYTVEYLSPEVTYTVECTSSNGEEACNFSMNTTRMPCTPQVYFNKSSSCSLQQLVFTFHTNTESYKCTLSINGIMAPNTEMMSDHELAYMVENISSNNNNTFECTPTDGRGICNPSNNGTMIP